MNYMHAVFFATKAHAGQFRKYSGKPYITHPIAVADLLSRYQANVTLDMYLAAILHDVVEDTHVTSEEVRVVFGDKVADLVLWLTNVSKPQDGTRQECKAINRAHTKRAPIKAQVIKVADVAHNLSDIHETDVSFAIVYLGEKRLLLEGMREEVKKMPIYTHAIEVLEHQEERLLEAA